MGFSMSQEGTSANAIIPEDHVVEASEDAMDQDDAIITAADAIDEEDTPTPMVVVDVVPMHASEKPKATLRAPVAMALPTVLTNVNITHGRQTPSHTSRDWNAIHQSTFAKMESIDRHLDRKIAAVQAAASVSAPGSGRKAASKLTLAIPKPAQLKQPERQEIARSHAASAPPARPPPSAAVSIAVKCMLI